MDVESARESNPHKCFFTKTLATVALVVVLVARHVRACHLFGIAIPTRHAVTFTALARVCVSSVSSLLVAFPLFEYFAPRFPFVPLWWRAAVPVLELAAFGLPDLAAFELVSTAFRVFLLFPVLTRPVSTLTLQRYCYIWGLK